MRNNYRWLIATLVAALLIGSAITINKQNQVKEANLNNQIEQLKEQSKARSEADKQKLQKRELELQQQVRELNEKLQSKAAEKARIAAETAQKAAERTIPQKVVQSIVPTAQASQGGSNETIAWNFLIANGFTRNQTAGIMGNLQQEHGFQTSDVRGGLGIAQWIGGRRSALMARPNYLDISVQLQFMLDELNGSNAHAGAAVRASATIEQAVQAFQNLYERCGICNEGARVQYAYAINARH